MDKNDIKVSDSVDETTPNEYGSLHVQCHIKIYDPSDDEVFIDKRA